MFFNKIPSLLRYKNYFMVCILCIIKIVSGYNPPHQIHSLAKENYKDYVSKWRNRRDEGFTQPHFVG